MSVSDKINRQRKKKLFERKREFKERVVSGRATAKPCSNCGTMNYPDAPVCYGSGRQCGKGIEQ